MALHWTHCVIVKFVVGCLVQAVLAGELGR
jgi:hypothetical protein